MADITSSGKLFLGGFWTFLTSFLVLHPLSWLRGAGFGCFKGEWRALRPMASFIAAAFGCFLLASWCYNHFLGFAERDLDVFRRMADITSSDRYFRYGFWTFFASLWVLHPLSWLYGAGFGGFQGDGGLYVQWRALSQRLLDVSC